ncbi:hypothetical protein QTP88_004515 [Uroleucon formosanum]
MFYLPSFTNNNIKNCGGLIIGSNNVVKVCQETERIIKSHPVIYFNNVKNKMYILTKVKMNLYKSIQLFHEIRKMNDKNIKFGRSRAKLTKMILFQHE